MKFASKKTVSEVTIDLEDGCILKLTQFNLINLSINVIREVCHTVPLYTVCFSMKNGISLEFKTEDDLLINDLNLLTSC